MQRRDLLKLIAATTGTMMVGGNAIAYEMIAPVPLSDTGFTKKDVSLLNEMGEVIIPKTDTPGAKEANVGETMAVLVADCYPPALQKTFKAGISEINRRCNAQFGKDFLLLSKGQKTELFNELDTEAKAANLANGVPSYIETSKPDHWDLDTDAPAPHYFTLLKQLTMYCFFTSKVGATKVLRYVAIPGYYDGDYPYKKGDKAWAT